ncbi:MAG: hypothetical protein ACJAZP_002017 [Psychromonas sp.]|jgi:hypothetical protein|uniref:DUF3300 domain-containing protein n=1 Tax=Psychromonas sp. TaxID=1884585 RepID=UPI0039E5719A
MKNITKSCYRSFTIALLILVALPAVFINKVNADELYEEQIPLSEAQLAQILAPIALYPDSLLTHILIASTYPLEIVQASRWRANNSRLDANQAINKAAYKNWDPSVSALLAFPNLLARLNDDLEWTQKLGAAFLEDETAVLLSIQLLRQQADRANSLSGLENMSVIYIDNQIIIESAHNGIIYVPYYDSRSVYGHWHSYPPAYWAPSPYYSRRSHASFYWGSGVQITFNYYFSTFNWYKHNIIVINHRNSHDYRKPRRIIGSNDAHRWQHKPQPYSRAGVKSRNDQRTPNRVQSKNGSGNEPHQRFNKKTNQQQLINNTNNDNKRRNTDRAEQQNKRSAKPLKFQQQSHNKVKTNQPQLTKNKNADNKRHNTAQAEQQNKRSAKPLKFQQQSNNRVKSNQPQLTNNKNDNNKHRNTAQSEQQNKRSAKPLKFQQQSNNRVKNNNQENSSLLIYNNNDNKRRNRNQSE